MEVRPSNNQSLEAGDNVYKFASQVRHVVSALQFLRSTLAMKTFTAVALAASVLADVAHSHCQHSFKSSLLG